MVTRSRRKCGLTTNDKMEANKLTPEKRVLICMENTLSLNDFMGGIGEFEIVFPVGGRGRRYESTKYSYNELRVALKQAEQRGYNQGWEDKSEQVLSDIKSIFGDETPFPKRGSKEKQE